MKKLVIQPNDAHQRLDRFLQKWSPTLTKTLIYKLLRKKQIKVNGQRATGNQILMVGDEIWLLATIFQDFATTTPRFPFQQGQPGPLDVIWEDEQIIVVNKPENLPAQPGDGTKPDNLVYRIQNYLFERGEYHPESELQFAPTIAHRLDQNTVGLVVGAKTAPALRALQAMFRQHDIQKTYLALVHGCLPLQKGWQTITNWITKGDRLVTVSDHFVPGAKVAITHYHPLRHIKGKYSLVEIQLETGRTHQIRATMGWLGFPLVGEQKYTKKGIDKDPRFKSQALVATTLKFVLPTQVDAEWAPLAYLNGKTITLPVSHQPFWVNW